VPQFRLVDPVQHQVGERDGEDQIFLLSTEEGLVLEPLDGRSRRRVPEPAGHVPISLCQKSAGPAAGVVDGLPGLGVQGADHGPDDLPWGKELAAVGVLLAHLEQQVLIDLGEGEEMGVVDMADAQPVHPVQDVPQVRLRVHPGALHRGHDAPDNPLLAARIRVGTPVRQQVQAVQVG
jgi:hypothetical protein